MQPKSVRVTIDHLGNPQVDFDGFVGEGCMVEAAKIKGLLAKRGVIVSDEGITLKPAYGVAQVNEDYLRNRPQAQEQTR